MGRFHHDPLVPTELSQQYRQFDVATAYNQAFFHQDGSDYQRWQVGHVLHHLRLQPTDQVVDIGCGTGVFTSVLYSKADLTQNILAVEASQSMLNHAQTLPGLTTHCTDALSFVQDHAIRYDKILMKEMVHHIPRVDLPRQFRWVSPPQALCFIHH